MSMGLGYGLSEELLVDEKTGRVLNDNLLDLEDSDGNGRTGFTCGIYPASGPDGTLRQ